MTLQDFIEKAKTDAALSEKINAAIMEKVIIPMAQAEGVELGDEELAGVAGGIEYPKGNRYNFLNGRFY